jgi:hypothetical protein
MVARESRVLRVDRLDAMIGGNAQRLDRPQVIE